MSLTLALSLIVAAPQATHGYASVAAGRVYYEACGSGPALILLHDGLLHSVVWDDVWPLLCESHHVVRYDRRGSGRSDAATAPFSPEDDLLRVAEQTGIRRAVLVGSSSGAGLALDFALAHPDRVEALVLVGPTVHGMRSSDWFNQRGSAMSAAVAAGNAGAAADLWASDPYQVHGANPAARKKIRDVLLSFPQNLTVAGQFEIRPSPPTVIRLSAIAAPTLLIVGDGDVGDVHAFSGAIQAAVSVVRREVWKDAGHRVQLEQPAALVSRIAAFVKVVERKTVTIAAADLARLAGDYRVGASRVTLAVASGRLVLRQNGEADVPLFAAASSAFFVRTTGTDVTFEQDDAGRAVAMIIVNPGSAPVRCPRL